MNNDVNNISINDISENSLNFSKVKKYSYLITKRLFDIILSLFGILFLIPLSIIIKISYILNKDYSSIFYTQTRIGKNGKEFKLYKFRSMIPNADEVLKELMDTNTDIFNEYSKNKKLKDDPRVTKVGKFIRKTSIDELPQLFNILKGDMSLVGPRPPIPREVEKYNEYQLQRLSVKPGLTCIWQVSGRNSIDFEQWIELDLQYIRERSILLDIKLIFKTFFVLFGDKNAY